MNANANASMKLPSRAKHAHTHTHANAQAHAQNQTQADTNITVESLDWLQVLGTRPPARAALFSLAHKEPVDLILVVDCIFNPSLLEALLETIDYYTVPGRTVVVVALELRADDVIREFLEGWLARADWKIWRVESNSDSDLDLDSDLDSEGNVTADGEIFLDPSYIVWIGAKLLRR